MSSTSTAFSLDTKNYAVEAGRSALEQAMKRRHAAGKALVYQYTYYIAEYSCDAKDKATIIVNYHNSLRKIKKCIDDLCQQISKKHEIIVVGVEKKSAGWCDFYQDLKTRKISVMTAKDPINLAQLRNQAARQAKGQYLLFMNDDIRLRDQESLKNMMGVAKQKHIGVMSGRMSDKKYIWQGVPILGAGPLGIVKESFARIKRDNQDPRINVTHNRSTVADTCFMIMKNKFKKYQGFDEKLGEEYSVVNLCLRALQKDDFNVIAPYIDVYQPKPNNSYARIKRQIQDAEYLKQKWGTKTFARDRFYNPNFSVKYFYTLKTDQER